MGILDRLPSVSSSDNFGILDLFGSTVVNMGATQMACQNAQFRWGIPHKGAIQWYSDYRFIAASAMTVAGAMLPMRPNLTRVCYDTANGLFGSSASTEMCRSHAVSRINAAQAAGQVPGAAAAQLSDGEGADPSGAKNYAYAGYDDDYGW